MPHASPAAVLVLASASARRFSLLRQIGLIPQSVDPPELDESLRKGELPGPHAMRLAKAKAELVAARHTGVFTLGADTVVALGRRILPKAESVDVARQCLDLLSGRRHRVLTAVVLIGPQGKTTSRLVTTAVRFKRLTRQEIDAYLASGEWDGKAGGYAIQGRADAFVAALNGSYSNVVGLPLHETAALLQGQGFPLWTA